MPGPSHPAVPLSGCWDFMCRGWRPAASWTCVAILAVRGVAVPIVELVRHQPIDRMDVMMLTALASMLGMAVLRSRDKQLGVAS